MHRGDSLVMDFVVLQDSMNPKDPVLDLAHTLQVRGEFAELPELKAPEDTCLDMARNPGRLSEWVNRFGSDTPIEVSSGCGIQKAEAL